LLVDGVLTGVTHYPPEPSPAVEDSGDLSQRERLRLQWGKCEAIAGFGTIGSQITGRIVLTSSYRSMHCTMGCCDQAGGDVLRAMEALVVASCIYRLSLWERPPSLRRRVRAPAGTEVPEIVVNREPVQIP
jgi:hypothetical protein